MKKIIISLCIALGLFFSFGSLQNTFAEDADSTHTKYLNKIKNTEDINISASGEGKESIYNFIVQIAETLKIIFFIAAIIYFMIIAIRLMVASNTEEETGNFKKGLLWISVGIIVINTADVLVKTVYKQDTMSLNNPQAVTAISSWGSSILENIIKPFINLLEFGAGFFFILIMIFAFFRLITSNGNEEAGKTGRMTVLYAIIGFIVVKISSTLVFTVYGGCRSTIASIFGATCSSAGANLSGFAKIIFNIINWLNSFVAVIVIVLVIFIGAQIIFSNGDEERITKARKSIIYIIIGVGVLLFNYIILTFFFNV